MREAQFSRTSWHCKLARFGGLSEYEEDTDICAYIRAAIKGLIGIAFLCALFLGGGGLIVWLLSDFFAWAACVLLYGFVWPEIPAGFVLGATVLGAVAGLAYLVGKGAKAGAHAAADTFIGDAMDSIKNRMCFRVHIRDTHPLIPNDRPKRG